MPRASVITAVVAAIVVAGVPGARALAQETPRPTRPSDTPPPPSCLDQSIVNELGQTLRPRGVQKKTFLKKHRFELVPRGGLYASDLLSSSYVLGGALAWYATEDLGAEVTFDVTPVAVDLDQPLADFFGDPRFTAGTGYLATASLLWSPIHFKVKTNGGSILHGDATFALGGGKLFHDTAQGIAFTGGLVVELYLLGWLSLRFDLRDVVLVQEAVAETRLTNNVTATMGLGLWVPFGF